MTAGSPGRAATFEGQFHACGCGRRHRAEQGVHDPLPARLDLANGDVVGEVVVTFQQGGDQITMLAPLILDTLAEVQAGEVQPLHLLKQVLQCLREAPIPRRLGEPDMELAALSDHRRKALVRIDLDVLLGERAQRLQLVCGGAFRGERCGRWFQEKTEVEDLLDIGEGEIRHPVALTLQDLDESLVAEHRQGLADRRLAHTQLLGEAAFVQACTGGQMAGEDLLLEDSVDPCGRTSPNRKGAVARGPGARNITLR